MAFFRIQKYNQIFIKTNEKEKKIEKFDLYMFVSLFLKLIQIGNCKENCFRKRKAHLKLINSRLHGPLAQFRTARFGLDRLGLDRLGLA